MNINNHPTLPTLLEHHTIYLDAATGATTDALWISDGRIVATGQEAKARATTQPHHHQRPEGRCIFPALTDAHAHPWGLAQRANTIDLSKLTRTTQIYDKLKTGHTHINERGWIVGKGWDQHLWEDAQTLSLAALDRHFPNTPVLLYRTDYHAIWCNSAAMQRAGIDPTAQTGLLVDEHMFPVTHALGPTTAQDNRLTLQKHAEVLHRHGITCVHQAYMRVADIQLLRHHDAPLRIYGMIDAKDKDLDQVLAAGPQHDPAGRWAYRTIKFFADGALGSQGALLHEPYIRQHPNDTPHVGQVVTSAQTLNARIPSLLEAGWQVAVHAIGDRAATSVIDAYALVDDHVRATTRPRLEHAQMLTDHDLQRIHTLGIIPSIQPIHFYSDMPWVHKHLTPPQRQRLYRWAELAAPSHAQPLAAGSDFPIDDPNPWHGISTALTRRAADGQTHAIDQQLDRHTILNAYTRGAAYAAHWEDILGHLHPGAVADWIALPDDPMTASPEAIWEMIPLTTHCAWNQQDG